MLIRPAIADDRPHLEAMVRECGAFTAAEVAVAMELIDHHLDGTDPDYAVVCAADDSGIPVGYICYGPVPKEDGAYDLYWIVVTPSRQRRGIGNLLLQWLEGEMKQVGRHILRAETASKPRYAGQRRFYEALEFHEVARRKDFYAPGDDKVVYEKIIRP